MTNTDVIEVVIPEEPQDGSVVLLASGPACQRQGRKWHRAGVSAASGNGLSWPHLVVEHGPVRVIHRAVTG